jgi:hypothetical protein
MNESHAHAPAQKPYRIASMMTLEIFDRPIIPRTRTAPHPAEAAAMLATPSELAKNPGTIRPTKLDALRMTN